MTHPIELLLLNDFVFFGIIAVLFFVFGFFTSTHYHEYRLEQHFWECYTERSKKARAEYVKNHVLESTK